MLYIHSFSTYLLELRSFIIFWSVITTSFLKMSKMGNLLDRLLCCCSEFTLDEVEQLLHRIQPGRVLGIEKHVSLELARCLVDGRMFVDSGVVHQDNNLLRFGLLVDSKFLQRPVKKVVKYHMVGASFRYLSRDNAVESQCGNHRQ